MHRVTPRKVCEEFKLHSNLRGEVVRHTLLFGLCCTYKQQHSNKAAEHSIDKSQM